MERWLKRSGIDARFVDLTILMCIGIWPWLIVTTHGMAIVAWKFVLFCQAVALPFAIVGWAYGFRLGTYLKYQPRAAAMVAGWMGLIVAEIRFPLAVWPWFERPPFFLGMWAFPGLALLVTLGVLWLYRASTWPKVEGDSEGMAA